MAWISTSSSSQSLHTSAIGLLFLATCSVAQDTTTGYLRSSVTPVTSGASDRFLGAVSDRQQQSRLPQTESQGLSGLLARGSEVFGNVQRRYLNSSPGSLMHAGHGSDWLNDLPLGVWGKGYGLFGQRDGQAGVEGYDYGVLGAGGGLDLQVADHWLLGITAGYSGGKVEYARPTDTTQLSALYGGLYASFSPDHWYMDSVITGARMGYDTERQDSGSTSDMLSGTYKGWEGSACIETGYDLWETDLWLLQPLMGFRYSHLIQDGYRETGGVNAQAYGDQHYDSLRGSLGLQITRRLFELDDTHHGRLELRASWNYEFQDTYRVIDSAAGSYPGGTLAVTDAYLPRNSAMIGAGLQVDTVWGCRVRLHYGTRLCSEDQAHIFSGQAEIRW